MRTFTYLLTVSFLGCIGTLVVSSCGSSGSSTAPYSVTGVAQLGPCEGCQVTLEAVDDGAVIATTATDSKGAYTFALNTPIEEPVYVVVTGDDDAKYLSEANNQYVSLLAGQRFRSLIESVDGAEQVAITPASEMTVALYAKSVEDEIAAGTFGNFKIADHKALREAAFQSVADLLGVEDWTILAAIPMPPSEITAATDPKVISYTQLLGTLDRHLMNQGVSLANGPAAYLDLAADVSDGKVGDEGSGQFSAVMTNFDNANTGFKKALDDYAASAYCPPVMRTYYNENKATVYGTPDASFSNRVATYDMYFDTYKGLSTDPCLTAGNTACPVYDGQANTSYDPSKLYGTYVQDYGTAPAGYVDSNYTCAGSHCGTYNSTYEYFMLEIAYTGNSRAVSVKTSPAMALASSWMGSCTVKKWANGVESSGNSISITNGSGTLDVSSASSNTSFSIECLRTGVTDPSKKVYGGTYVN